MREGHAFIDNFLVGTRSEMGKAVVLNTREYRLFVGRGKVWNRKEKQVYWEDFLDSLVSFQIR